MQDNAPCPPGKEACRYIRRNFGGQPHRIPGCGGENVLVSGEAGITTIEWHFDYTIKNGACATIRKVAVQRWKDGKIVNEISCIKGLNWGSPHLSLLEARFLYCVRNRLSGDSKLG